MSWRPSEYRCDIETQWIDYNGHLRDAYYTLVFSQAIDALMDEVGLDDAYRARSGCTLYTLETHVHYLDEVKSIDAISVRARAIGVDAKRIHLGLALHCTRLDGAGSARRIHVAARAAETGTEERGLPARSPAATGKLACRGPAGSRHRHRARAGWNSRAAERDGRRHSMNAPDLQRLLVPRTVALIGSGAWTDAVAAGAQTLGFSGEVWRVHPTRQST